MKSSWISDNTRITVYKMGAVSVCETEYLGSEKDFILEAAALLNDFKDLKVAPRGMRANRMKLLIEQGNDKVTIRKILTEEGYEFNPPGIFHSEYARLSKK